jgi:hypothetical protein
MNNTLTIDKNLAQEAYASGGKDVKKALESLIGKSALIGTPLGIWCLNDKNELITAKEWNASHSPVGVVIVTEETSFVIGLHASVTLQWGAMDKAKCSLVCNKESYDAKTATDAMIAAYAGAHYEDGDGKIWNVDGSPAAEWCRKHSAGHIAAGSWDLPTVAQLLLMRKHRDEINDCIIAMDGYKLTSNYHWSSIATENPRSAYYVNMGYGGVSGNSKCNDLQCARGLRF